MYCPYFFLKSILGIKFQLHLVELGLLNKSVQKIVLVSAIQKQLTNKWLGNI